MTPSQQSARRKRAMTSRHAAFTLVELLVVIGIIGVLLAILMPSLTKARKQASKTACMSNLKQVFIAMQIYSTDNKAWLFPVGENNPFNFNRPTTLGTDLPPHERWPALVKAFGIKVPAGAIQYRNPMDGTVSDGTSYPGGYSNDEQPIYYPAEDYTPKVMVCPEDPDPVEYHSYIVNKHLADERIRFGTQRLGKLGSSSEVVVAGEKKTEERDYYMEDRDFTIRGLVEQYRHGVKLGSNYLFLDGHVDSRMPDTVKNQIDPWDPDTTDPENPTP